MLTGQSRHAVVSYVSFQYVPGTHGSQDVNGSGRYSPGKQVRVGAKVGMIVGASEGPRVGRWRIRAEIDM
jgi:hypothetical protein